MTAPSLTRAGDTVRTMGRVMFTDPVRQGRLRLDGLPPLVMQLAIVGVVALGSLLGSLVLTDLWRRGPLTLVREFEGTPNLSAKGVIPFTVVALAVAWVLVLAGGSLARPPVAVLAGLAFLLFNSSLADPSGRTTTLALRVLPTVVRICYFTAPAAVVVLSLLRRTERARFLRPVAAVVLAGAAAGFFLGNVALYVIEDREGLIAGLPRLLDGAMNELQGFLVPLFLLAVAALVQLNHQVARGAASPFWSVSAGVAKALVLLLIALKLRYGLLGQVDRWTTYIAERQVQAVQALAYLVLVAAAAWWLSRLSDDDGPQISTESVVYSGALLVSAAVVIAGLVISGGFFLGRIGFEGVPRWVLENFPTTFLVKYLTLGIFAVLFVAGVVLSIRPRRAPWDRRLGALLALVSAWVVPGQVLNQLVDRDVGFDIGLVDLALTLAALVYIVVRWRRLDTAATVRVGGLLVFASLVAGNGYVATRLATRVLAFFTPPAVLLIVLGVLYVVLADSSFASVSSRNFPRETRVLLWLGYLIFVVAVTNYVLVAREPEYRIEFDRYGYYLLALPLAAWLAFRSRMTPPEPSPDEG